MLTKEDLAQIEEVVERISARQMNLVVENVVMPQLQMLAEGQQMLLETLAPKNRVEALEDEMSFMKQVIKSMSQEIAELKKAQ